MRYYSDVTPWNMGGQKVNVTIDNDHLGQIVSGVAQEQKNVDIMIQYLWDAGTSFLIQMPSQPCC